MAGSKVVNVNVKKRGKKTDKKKKGAKPKPVPVAFRPPVQQRCPFSISAVLCSKHAVMMQLLLLAGLPFTVLSTVEMAMKQMGSTNVDLDCVELFAGVKTVAFGFQRLGFRAATYEIKDDPQLQNMLGPLGFIFALSLCIRLFRTVGFGWFAPVCSTWVWINRGTSGRSQSKPLGNYTISKAVREANWMTGRCLLCIYMMCALGIPFCLEQPSSSVMEYHPCFKFLSSRYKIFKVFIWMGAYGGHSPKGTWLYSNYEVLLKNLFMPLSDTPKWGADMVTKYIDHAGRSRVCGSTDLKASQHYPSMFGRTIAETVAMNKSEIEAHAISLRQDLLKKPRKEMKDCGWSHYANLRPVIACVHGQ